jgi:CRISPR-associated exonuclease Cas4
MDVPLQVPLSSLYKYSYCDRQAALIYSESIYEDNTYTLIASQEHQRTHSQEIHYGPLGQREERALHVWSDSIGVYGVTDVVEFHKNDHIVPIEYKPHWHHGAALQLCGQSLCLEEIFGRIIEYGYVYIQKTRRRHKVEFNELIRHETLLAIEDIRRIMQTGDIPLAPNDERCKNCSLYTACMPALTDKYSREKAMRIQKSLFKVEIDD